MTITRIAHIKIYIYIVGPKKDYHESWCFCRKAIYARYLIKGVHHKCEIILLITSICFNGMFLILIGLAQVSRNLSSVPKLNGSKFKI